MKVFISYAREDAQMARKLYDDLTGAGLDCWFDEEDLVPGQNWQIEIPNNIKKCERVCILLSSRSVEKIGYVQNEMKLALDTLDSFPSGHIYIIPVRLDECKPAHPKLQALHWADLFPDYQRGFKKILRSLGIVPGTAVKQESKEFLNSLAMQFVLIKPGTFKMGSPDDEPERYKDEVLHEVTLTSGFYMQTTQATVGQWRQFAKEFGYKSEAETSGGAYTWTGSEWKLQKGIYWDNPGFAQTDSHPVTCVSWNDAQKLIEWLSKKEGKTYRLPTEAQWEYACRAGTTTPFAFGNCLSTDDANYNGNWPLEGCPKGEWRQRTVPVGSLKANAWGLYDMYGNVWEWCEDWYEDYPTGSVVDPTGPSTGAARVLRGGGWNGSAGDCRSALRDGDAPAERDANGGFRLVLPSGQR
jgi:formylglycine-generating enzyme required for sulfatase activity